MLRSILISISVTICTMTANEIGSNINCLLSGGFVVGYLIFSVPEIGGKYVRFGLESHKWGNPGWTTR